MRLLPLVDVLPLNTMRNLALGLLSSPVTLLRSKNTRPKDVGGLYGAPKLVNVTPSVEY